MSMADSTKEYAVHEPEEARSSEFGSFEEFLSDSEVVDSLRAVSPSLYDTASEFWTACTAGHLSAKTKELVLLAMHATATAMNVAAIRRHIGRAQRAGATEAEILDVLITIVAVANHALYTTVPILAEEMESAGIATDLSPMAKSEFQTTKEEFIASRGFWNADRDQLARMMPEYYKSLSKMSTESWKSGALTAKEREFVCIGIDCTVTHVYEPGLRRHIRLALGHGATREEICEIFQLAAVLGLEGYAVGADALFGTRDDG
jgi:alkylhydroperoxidase/carboxymuconolactone decarboxylase family protein YurZ